MALKVKRCVHCGGDADVWECGMVVVDDAPEEPKAEETYTSNFGKKRPKPADKMISGHSDK